MKKLIQKVISILLTLTFLIPSTIVFAEESQSAAAEILQETVFYAENSCALPVQTATDNIVQVIAKGEINTLPVLNNAFGDRMNEISNVQDSVFSNTQSSIQQDVYSLSTAYYLSNIVSLNATIIAKNALTVSTSVLQAQPEDFAVLVSQQKDITLSGADISFQGILYAPNGTVTISASKLDFRGVIIAQNIQVDASNASFAYDARVEQYLASDAQAEPLPEGVEIYEKPLNPNDILEDSQTGIQYVKGQVLLTATEGVAKVEVAEIVKPYGGRIAGYISVTNDYQIVLEKATNKAELDQVIAQLETNPKVESVLLHWVFENEFTATPNDPWNAKDGDGKTITVDGWNESSPSGSNWGLEATKVLSAWEKQADMKPVKVGVIDSGIHNHEDLNPKLKLNGGTWNPPVVDPKTSKKDQEKAFSERNHGTHVTGIIGAIANNGKGVSGVAPNAELYSVAMMQAQAFTTKRSLAELIVRDIKVINYSISRVVISDISDIVSNYQQSKDYFDNLLTNFLLKLINSGYDFLIIQGAGNSSNIENDDGEKENGWVDSQYGCHFNALNSPEVNKHIIVVGAYGTTGNQNYHIYSRSQIGDRVDILAPGEGIASLVEKNETFIMNGTSMAAPHVTGVAAMVWGINPNLTAEQVKEILISTATDKINVVRDNTVKDYLLSGEVALNRGYPRLDAAAAVIRAEKEIGQGTGDPKDTGVLMGKLVFPNVAVDPSNYPSISVEAVPVSGGIAGKHPTQVVKSDANGEFSFVLPAGEYIINIVSTSFELPEEKGTIDIYPFSLCQTVKAGEVQYLETVELIQRFETDKDKIVNITGTVRDALNNGVVRNADIFIEKNWGMSGETGDKSGSTNANGAFIDAEGNLGLKLFIGYYTATVKKDGYITARFNIAVKSTGNPEFKFVITPKLSEDEIRIVLTWGGVPRDLDTHVIGFRDDTANTFHIYYWIRDYIDSQTNIHLDHDITTSYGPETVTIKKRNSQQYHYYVYNFSGPHDRPIGEAQVMVYWGNDNVSKFIIPPQQTGAYWSVFAIEGDKIISINTVSNTPPALKK